MTTDKAEIERIRNGAPDDAEYYMMFGAYGAFMYFKAIDGVVYHYYANQWEKSSHTTVKMLIPLY